MQLHSLGKLQLQVIKHWAKESNKQPKEWRIWTCQIEVACHLVTSHNNRQAFTWIDKCIATCKIWKIQTKRLRVGHYFISPLCVGFIGLTEILLLLRCHARPAQTSPVRWKSWILEYLKDLIQNAKNDHEKTQLIACCSYNQHKIKMVHEFTICLLLLKTNFWKNKIDVVQ